MLFDFNDLRKKFFDLLDGVDNLKKLEELRIKFFGKNGEIKNLMCEIKNIALENKKEFGAQVNNLKSELEAKIAEVKKKLHAAEQTIRFESEKIDISLKL